MKLHGAAAKSHARKLARRRRRKNPARRRRGRKSSWRSRAAKKAARTRAHKKAIRRAAARKAARSRRRRHGGHRRRARRRHSHRAYRRRRRRNPAAVTAAPTTNPRRRRRRRRSRHNPHRRARRYHRRYHRRRRNPRPTTARSMFRARRSIRNRYKTSLAKAVKRRFRMRSNPGLGGTVGGFVSLVKQAAPVALALYASRAISSRLLARSLPGINRLPAAAQSPVVAGLVAFGANVATKRVRFLAKYRGAVMMGVGLNLFDALFAAIAPASVKSMFGLGDYLEISGGLYNGVGDYLEVGGTPIDDDITLSDYVSVGLEEELGIEEELGLEEELGTTLDRANLGGVSSNSMLRKISQQSLLQKIPDRSFTREINAAGPGYDKDSVLYGGIFGGGF